MTFNKFKELASKVTNLELPGKQALFEMAPMQRVKELKDADIEKRNPKQAAVLAVFFPDDNNETKLVLILRKTYKGVHSAQIGFPGGKVEATDTSLEHTAKRETFEEVGIAEERITIVKKMTQTYIPPSNFYVQPYIAMVNETPQLTKQDDEVEAIVVCDFKDLLEDETLIEETLSTSYATQITVPAFHLEGYVVWGATAMMLNEMKQLFKKAL